MFRNASFVRLSGAWPSDEAALDKALAKAGFTPCGPLTEKSSGWEAPVATEAGTLCRSIAGADLIQLRTQSRILPTAAINEALDVRLEEFRERMGEPAGRREKRRLKAETRDELLTKALLKSERTRAFFLRAENVLAIDAASPNRIEHFLEMLKAGIGKFDADALDYSDRFDKLMNTIFLGKPPPGIRLGRECRMQDPADRRASVRFVDMDLSEANVRKHIRDGMKLTHLGIEFNNVMSCVVDEQGGLGKLKLSGTDADEAAGEDDTLSRFDAEFVLLAGTIRELLDVFRRALD